MRSIDILLKPGGLIRTPYRDAADNVPIQGRLAPQSETMVDVFPEYRESCRDLEGFSHVILIYYFHASTIERLADRPYMDTEARGIFSVRSPHRPNHIGITLVELLGNAEGVLQVRGVDMIDGTPLLDIKPYNPLFDAPGPEAEIRIGWMSKYMNGESGPRILRIANRSEWLHEEKTDE